MDERLLLSNKLKQEIVDAASVAIDQMFQQQTMQAKTDLARQQSKRPKAMKRNEERTEAYPIKVIKKMDHYDRLTAEIAVAGCDTYCRVKMLGGKTDKPWELDYISVSGAIDYDRTEFLPTYESAIQRGVVGLLAHVWYG